VTPLRAIDRRRSFPSLLGALACGVTLLVSCDAVNKFQLTLRSRGFDGVAFATETPPCPQAENACPANFSESSWVAADGRTAIALAHTTFFRADESPDVSESQRFDDQYYYGNVACGGQDYKLRYYRKLDPKTRPNGAFELDVDDGNRLTLKPQSVVSVEDGRDTLCFEEEGTWRGTAGEVRNKTGTFNLRYDSIETVLELVED
jgi:hypothetical protein